MCGCLDDRECGYHKEQREQAAEDARKLRERIAR